MITMQSGSTRLLHGFVLATALSSGLTEAATPIAHFPYLPGGGIIQVEKGGSHLFAVAGHSVWIDVNVGGHFLYSRHPDSAAWKLVRSSPPSRALASWYGPIRFQGSLGDRAFFTLEDTNSYFSGNGGATFTRVSDLPFQSNVAVIGGLAFAIFDSTVHTSADSGLTWTRLSARLAAQQLISIGGTIYARGARIWQSDDSGRTWREPREGLPSDAVGPRVYGLHLYDGRILASTAQGSFAKASASSPWAPLGAGNPKTQRVFGFGGELLGYIDLKMHRYDPETGAWEAYAPWGPGKAMGNINFGSLCCITDFGSRWIVGDEKGLMAFDPGTGDFTWFDAGIRLAPFAWYGALSGSLVAAHRSQLVAVASDGDPVVLRDFRKPGTPSGNISLASIEPADSVLWAYSDSTLFRLEKHGSLPSIRDSVRVPAGRYFCQGGDLIGVTAAGDPLSGQGTETIRVRVSRNAGATFVEFPHLLGLPENAGFIGLRKIASAYIWNDTAWLWDVNSDYHAFDLATGGYRFGENSIPFQMPVGNTMYPIQALSTGHAMVVKQSNNILVSADGGRTWNPGTRGISGTMAEGSRIQKHAGRLYLASGTTLYHTDEADLQWSKIDLLELAGASGGITGALVAKEGIYVQKGSEDVALFPWSDIPTSARPHISRPSPTRAGPHSGFHRGQGMIFLRNGTGYTIEGRAAEHP